MKYKPLPVIGVVGVLGCIAIFVKDPSFPTPDKLLIFMTFLFMIFGQTKEMLKRFLPFVAILLVYESLRGFADNLNSRVEYMLMPHVDRFFFLDTLPTTRMQQWLWHGHVQWYDFMFYVPYMLHFVIPIVLAISVWKLQPQKYWQLIVSYVATSFTAFIVFMIFPAAPPWMASQAGLIEPIHRVSSDVWWSLGIKDFPSVYSKVSPNAVAAVPSLHAAYATLFALYVTALFKGRWRFLAWVYPVLIYVGTIYQGEHYFIDELLGALLAVGVFFASPYITTKMKQLLRRIQMYSTARIPN